MTSQCLYVLMATLDTKCPKLAKIGLRMYFMCFYSFCLGDQVTHMGEWEIRSVSGRLLACVSQKTRKLLGPEDFSGLFSGEFLGSRKAFLNAPENTPDSHPSFAGCFLGFAA